MKKLFLLFILASPALFAQGVASPAEVALSTVNGVTRPIANATITVCAANAGGIPCAPASVSTIFSNSVLSTPLSNPFTSDINGNYQFFAAPGQYTVTVTSSLVPGFGGFSYQVTLAPSSAAIIGAGSITMAGGTGSHTFSSAYGVPPICVATDTTSAAAVKVTSTTTAVTVTGTGTDVINWHCTPAAN